MSNQVTKTERPNTALDLRNVSSFLQPVDSLAAEGDRVIQEVEERAAQELRRNELAEMGRVRIGTDGLPLPGALSDAEWSPIEAEVRSLIAQEEPTFKAIHSFIENLRDMLAMLPVAPAYVQTYRREIEQIRIVETGGQVGTWDRAKRDLLILKTRLAQLAADLREPVKHEPTPNARQLRPGYDPDHIDLTEDEEAYFSNPMSGGAPCR